MTHNLTVTIIIPAYNEAGNLPTLLTALSRQNCAGFTLSQVIVISDGSTDQTAAIARRHSWGIVQVKAYSQRLGKAYRLGQIFPTLHSDLIVQFDADITPVGPSVLHELILPFTLSPNLVMTSGNSRPLPPTTFAGRAIAVSVQPYVALRHRCPALSVGPLLCYRRDWAQTVKFPKRILGEDIYLYFSCLVAGGEFRYIAQAIVHYRLPQTWADHIRQNTRFLRSPGEMSRYFPATLIAREDQLPRLAFVTALISEFVHHPVLSLCIFVVNQYCRWLVFVAQSNHSPRWVISATTKGSP